jgi:hypothetical protein
MKLAIGLATMRKELRIWVCDLLSFGADAKCRPRAIALIGELWSRDVRVVVLRFMAGMDAENRLVKSGGVKQPPDIFKETNETRREPDPATVNE